MLILSVELFEVYTVWMYKFVVIPINHWKRTVCGVTFHYFSFITSKIKKIGSIFSPKHIFQVPHEHHSTFLRFFTINYSIPLQYPFVHKKLNALEHLHAHSQKSKYTTPTKKKVGTANWSFNEAVLCCGVRHIFAAISMYVWYSVYTALKLVSKQHMTLHNVHNDCSFRLVSIFSWD